MNKRIVFMGTPDFAVQSLNAIVDNGYEVACVVTVPDKKSGRGQKVTMSPVKEYALQHNLPLLQPEKLRDTAFLTALKETDADIFVVVAFRMLPEVVWAMPPLGTFNLHASLLPQYRGAAPINWALINGEKMTGVSTFMLNQHIDEGLLLMQKSTPISDDDDAGTLHDRLADMGAGLVVETLDALCSGTITPHQQDSPERLNPAPKIFRQDCIIDWRKNGKDIVNFVRGLSPYPAANCDMHNAKGEIKSLKIFAVRHEPASTATVGEITSDRRNYLKIGVNDGYIHILNLQISGKKRMNIDEFLRGYDIWDWKLDKYKAV